MLRTPAQSDARLRGRNAGPSGWPIAAIFDAAPPDIDGVQGGKDVAGKARRRRSLETVGSD